MKCGEISLLMKASIVGNFDFGVINMAGVVFMRLRHLLLRYQGGNPSKSIVHLSNTVEKTRN
jgi:hypothetical protein